MSRLFEDAGKTKGRKWQCFVCGKNHTDYEEYREHIVTEHAEGREYICCPAEGCGAPVRDLKVHYRAKHPNRPLPQGIQHRVAIWRDFKSDGSKKKTKKPKFRQGTFTSKKNGRDFIYRSGMEEEFFNLLEQDRDVAGYHAEPFKVPYFWQGKWHDYIPDLRIDYIDGSTEVWEVKPADQTHYEQNRAKWAAMTDHAHNMGWDFIVQTEVGLGKLRTKIKRQQVLTD
jgi:hypothetical protein